jgi:3-deoxy-D-manno-octulosonic-acid transferase
MIYNFIIYLYSFLFFIAKNFSKKYQVRYLGLQSIKFPTKSKKRIWIHCASAGEYEQTIPLIQSIREKYTIELVISFFSPSGMNYYNLSPKADYAFYLPFDTPNQAKKIVQEIQADYIIWVRYEFWGNFLNTIFKENIPCNLLFADFQKIEKKTWIEKNRIIKLLSQFSNIYSVSSPKELNIAHQIIHDGKWQQSLKNTSQKFEDPKVQFFTKNQNCIIIGSAHLSDVQILSEYLKKYPENSYKWLIVPHEIDEKHIAKIQSLLPHSILHDQENQNSSILIIPQMGVLKYLYRFANIAWIGGGLDKSIHNALEAAAYGLPMISGSNLAGAIESEILKKAKVLLTFNDANQLSSVLENIQKTDSIFYQTTLLDLYKKNAVDNYSTLIIDDIQKQLFTCH